MGIFDKFLNAIRINEDEDYDDEEFYDEEDEAEEDSADVEEPVKQKKSFFSRIAKKNNDDDLDDFDEEDELDEEPVKKAEKPAQKRESEPAQAAKPARSYSPKLTPIRRKGGSMEVNVIKPSSMEDTREIADTLLSGSTVVLNLEGIDVDMAQRVIDFTSGACYAIDGSLQKVSSYIFILTPQSVEISGDITDILGGANRSEY